MAAIEGPSFGVLEEKDLPEVNRILNIREVNKWFNLKIPLQMAATIKWHEEVISNRKKRAGECSVVRVNGVLVGWSYAFELYEIDNKIKEMLDRNCLGERKGYIAATVVDPKFWGRGLAKKLIMSDEKFLASMGIFHVWFGTNADNFSLKSMHEGLRYRVIGVIPAFKTRPDGTVVDQHIYYKHI